MKFRIHVIFQTICLTLIFFGCLQNLSYSQELGVIYKNPVTYNAEISFEIAPDLKIADREQNLKVWIPIPREWDSQMDVQILSVHPEPNAQYTDSEYGNIIYYWDFAKYPVKPSYKVTIQVKLLSYEVHTMIDSSNIKPYDKTKKEYKLYTQSGHTIHITPKIKELAQQAIEGETNPYVKAHKILKFVYGKIMFNQGMNRSIDYMIDNSKYDIKSQKTYFLGDCTHYSALFVALCRSEGIPARCVYGRIGWLPDMDETTSKMYSELDTMLSNEGFSGAQHHGLWPHMWAEFYLPDYGWIPVDANIGEFGQLHNKKIIMSKGRDIYLGPHIPTKHHNGYGYQWVPIHNGRVDGLLSAVYNIKKITNARSNVFHSLK